MGPTCLSAGAPSFFWGRSPPLRVGRGAYPRIYPRGADTRNPSVGVSGKAHLAWAPSVLAAPQHSFEQNDSILHRRPCFYMILQLCWNCARPVACRRPYGTGKSREVPYLKGKIAPRLICNISTFRAPKHTKKAACLAPQDEPKSGPPEDQRRKARSQKPHWACLRKESSAPTASCEPSKE